jgi:hypothetical protein
MPLYRTLERIVFDDDTVFNQFIVSPLKGVPKSILKILLAKGRITEVQTPPLAVLPGWEERAVALEPLGIENVSQLVDADLDKVAEKLDTPVKSLRKAAREAQSWMQVEEGGDDA